MCDLSRIRKDVEQFSQEISKEFYLQGAGLKQEVNFNAIYKRYPRLFTQENLTKISSALDDESTNGNESRRLSFFVEAFYSEIMGNRTKNLVSKFILKETGGRVRGENGKSIAYRSSMVKMLNEKSRKKRESLSLAIDKYTEKTINPILEKIVNKERQFVKEMGFENKVQMFNALSGIDLYSLNDSMQEFLKATEDIYVACLEKVAKERIGISVSELKRHDLLFLMRAKQFDPLFPKNQMFPKISSFVKKMGIDISARDNIVFDLDARENKSPRAFCSPVRIPDEVYLVIYPRGGEDDYTTFLHELGHALHFANIDSGLEFEYKWYGDNSVTEGFAMSFDHLTMNENWTKRILGFDKKTNPGYFEHRILNELIMLRRYAAKIDYEIRLHEDESLKGKKELYSSVFEQATKIKYSPENYLIDVDPNFYCARYLRAWMFQANMHSNMQDAHDTNWFESPRAGRQLTELWSLGQKFNADEMMEMNGWGKLSMNILHSNIMSFLSN